MLLTILPLLTQGCASANRSLILTSTTTTKSFSQSFSQRYAARNDDGSYEFLLISDDADQTTHKSKPGQPLRPTNEFPLREIVHVKIAWLPMRGNMAESTVSNATATWYIFSDAPDHQQDLLLYSGTGFALAYENGDKISLHLKGVPLTRQISRGGLTDPLGAFTLSGVVSAHTDADQVHQILANTRSRLGLSAP